MSPTCDKSTIATLTLPPPPDFNRLEFVAKPLRGPNNTIQQPVLGISKGSLIFDSDRPRHVLIRNNDTRDLLLEHSEIPIWLHWRSDAFDGSPQILLKPGHSVQLKFEPEVLRPYHARSHISFFEDFGIDVVSSTRHVIPHVILIALALFVLLHWWTSGTVFSAVSANASITQTDPLSQISALLHKQPQPHLYFIGLAGGWLCGWLPRIVAWPLKRLSNRFAPDSSPSAFPNEHSPTQLDNTSDRRWGMRIAAAIAGSAAACVGWISIAIIIRAVLSLLSVDWVWGLVNWLLTKALWLAYGGVLLAAVAELFRYFDVHWLCRLRDEGVKNGIGLIRRRGRSK